MPDESMRDMFAQLEARISDQDARLMAQEAELGRYRARRRTRRTPRWLRRVQGRLGAALVLVLLVATVPASLLATDRFPDVPTANPHHDDVNQIAAAGITIGFPDGTYKPDAFVTRGQMASFLARTAGLGGRAPVVNATTALTANTATNATNAQTAVSAQTADTANTANSATTAGSITGQANSATIPATSANTPGTIVQRDGGGNFAAGTITATLNGDAASVDGKSANELVRVARSAPVTGPATLLTAETYATIATVNITAPAPGFVLVTGGTTVQSNTGQGVAGIRLRDTATGGETSPLLFVGIDSTNGIIVESATPTWVFQVAAASPRSYVLEGSQLKGTGPFIAGGISAQMTAIYVPFGSAGAGTLGVDGVPAPAGDGSTPLGR